MGRPSGQCAAHLEPADGEARVVDGERVAVSLGQSRDSVMARRIGDDRAPVVVPARAFGYHGWSIRTTADVRHENPPP
jgi:hypothetical protein